MKNDKLLLLLVVTMFILAFPIAFATTGSVKFGNNYSINAQDYIAYTRFNQSNGEPENLATGQAWVDDLANPQVINQQLYLTGNSKIHFLQDFTGLYTKNYTCDIIASTALDTGNGFTYLMFGDNKFFAGWRGWGDALYFSHYDYATSIYSALTPQFQWQTSSDTTILYRTFVNNIASTYNMTVYNFSVSNDIITLTELTKLSNYASTRADEVGEIALAHNQLSMNSSEIACYNGTARPGGVVPPDTTPPKVNITINNTALSQGISVNITGNSSDNIGLDTCRISINQTPSTIEYFNFSLSGTSGYCGQNFTIKNVNDIINFTTWVNDTSGNFNQSSTLIISADITPPQIINFSLQRQPIMNKTQTNIISIFCEDTQSGLKQINFTMRYNITTLNLTRILTFGSSSYSGNNGTYTTTFALSSVPPSVPDSEPHPKSFIWNYSIFNVDETAKEGFYNITHIGCRDDPGNSVVNSSLNKLVGYDFLMDTSPTLSARNPSNSSTITEYINAIFNFTAIEENPSMALLYTNISGKMLLNQTIDYLDSTSTSFNELNFTLGNFVWAIHLNTSFGTWTNSSNFTINFVDNPPILNTISPANKSTVSTTEVNISITATETNPDSMILYLNGILNQTKSYVGDAITLNKFTLNLTNGNIINWSVGMNTTFGTMINSSNFTFTVDINSPPSDGGTQTLGGGEGLASQPIQNITVVSPERCGNFVCEGCNESSYLGCVEETPLSCPQDCKAFSLDEAFCTPIFNCGNWKKSWFLNGFLFLVVGGLIYTQYTADKKKKKGRLG